MLEYCKAHRAGFILLSTSRVYSIPPLAALDKMAEATAQLLPAQRQMQALAQQGKSGWVDIPDKASGTRQKVQTVRVNGEFVPYVASEWQEGGKYYTVDARGRPEQPRIRTQITKSTTPTTKRFWVDFTGIGSADVQGAVADQMARAQLELSKKYDSQFIDQALEQEKLADPESFAARDKMSSLIQDQINRKPDRPVADLLDKQVGDELTAAQGHTLDPATMDILDQATAQALGARGGTGGQEGDFVSPQTTGFAGEARRAAAVKKAQGWLSSGATPEDVTYRREQQNLANLSAQVTGQTPTSQFKNLSGAQQGPTPVNNGSPLMQMPTNTTQVGQQGALMQQQAQNSQANPWLSGMSALLSMGSAAGKAGWKPMG